MVFLIKDQVFHHIHATMNEKHPPSQIIEIHVRSIFFFVFNYYYFLQCSVLHLSNTVRVVYSVL